MSCVFFNTVYNDGTKKDLMSLTGTLPVMFDGNLHFVILFNSEVHSSQFKVGNHSEYAR